MLHACVQRLDVTGNLENFLELNKLEMKKFFGVTSNVSEGCREGFLETNKKQIT